MRTSYSFLHEKDFIDKALRFADRLHQEVVYLNPNAYSYPHGAFQHVLAFGKHKELPDNQNDPFESLKDFLSLHKDWVFGYFSYDLKNKTEQLTSSNPDMVHFPLLRFFVPQHLIFFGDGQAQIQSMEDPKELFEKIQHEQLITFPPTSQKIVVQQKIERDDYISKIKQLQKKISEGDVYEINFCMEYYAEHATISPLSLYQRLNEVSPMPFSSYLKTENHYLLCASPERFLKREKKKLVSQPIKGTSKRDADPERDQLQKNALASNTKERAENIMIVDLVRNDLSRTAVPGSVVTEELCGIYSFPNVHQMISTVVAALDPLAHPVDAIKNAFPMGSMTGAPKVRAMELIEEYEETKRGLFSGAVGYFTPDLDFDFNVVIRSILYNAQNNYLSFQAGSAITFYSEAEKEYEECGVKTAAIREILNS